MPVIFGLVQNNSLVIFPGTFHAFGGGSTPSGWLQCDGSAVSRTTYSALFTAIGTTWGVGDGSTTFNLPDTRGRSLIGSGTGVGLSARTVGTQNIGEETHLLSVPEMPSHAHTDAGHAHAAGVACNQTGSGSGGNIMTNFSNLQSTTAAAANIQSTGGGGAHNNMQPCAVAQMIIKY